MKKSMTLLTANIALIAATVLSAQITFAAPDSQSEMDEFRAHQIADQVRGEEARYNSNLAVRRSRSAELNAIVRQGEGLAKSGTLAQIEEFKRLHGSHPAMYRSNVMTALGDRVRELQSPAKKAAKRIPVFKAAAAGLAAYSTLSNASESQGVTVDGNVTDSALRSTDLSAPNATVAPEEPATFTRSSSQTAR